MHDSFGASALAVRLSLSPLRGRRLQSGAWTYPYIVSVLNLSSSDFADRGHRDAGQQVAVEPAVPSDLPYSSGQNRALGTRA
jgi:hypothetical protein